jgi:hypothetical protein
VLSRLPLRISSACGLVSTVALAAVAMGLAACDRLPSYEGPELSAFEQQQHQRCVALLRSAWQGAPVRSTSAERGASGLDYVWVNVDVDDDHDDIQRRTAKGTQHAGHCQFDQGGDVVHVHSYALNGTQALANRQDESGYRYFTAGIKDAGVAAAPALPPVQR